MTATKVPASETPRKEEASGSVARKPNFFIVGAPKCGTTAIYTYLAQHDQVFFPQNAKEPHHYNTDMPNFRWFPNREEYLKLFSGSKAASAKVVGEASVQYLYSTEAAANIARDLPDARILICLRNPAAFIRSYHNQMLINLDEDIENLKAAWDMSDQHRTVAREPRMLNYKAAGRFSEQIARYRSVFPDNQIRILTLEEFTKFPREHYLALLEWLEIEDDGRTSFEPVHKAARPRSRRVSAFLKSPPDWVKRFVNSLKRTFGIKSFGVARLAKKANKASGYKTSHFAPEVAEEINSYFSQDQQSLEAFNGIRLWNREEMST